MGIASDLIYIVLAALFGGVVARCLGQPLILGYILAGVIVGPHTAGPTVVKFHDIEKLAEIGVALLLFALGLEFSLRELRRLWKVVFIATPVQMILTGMSGFLLAKAIGLPPIESLWFGSIMSLSSTMVVLKCLTARDSLDTEHGRVMLGVLIAQDLAIIPLMLILPQLSGNEIQYGTLVWALVKSLLFLAAMYVAGTQIFPRVFSRLAGWGSRELFLVCTLGVALGMGLVSHELGLSFAFGAFVAGIMMSETDFNHQALSDISSLRDLFGLVFFVSVGMLLDPGYLLENRQTALLVLAGVLTTKTVFTALSVRMIGYKGSTSAIAGFGLSQIGEFAFLIAQAGVHAGAITQGTSSLIIGVAVMSMLLTPGLLAIAPWIYARKQKLLGRAQTQELASIEKTAKRDHAVIIGAGEVGQQIMRAFALVGVDAVAVEYDYLTGRSLRNEGAEVIFGDASHPVILHAANVTEARLVLLTVTDANLTVRILQELRAINPHATVVARVEEVTDAARLLEHRIHALIEPQREAAIEMLRQGLLSLGMGEGRIFHVLSQVRALSYDGAKDNTNPAALKKYVSEKLVDMSLHEVGIDSAIVGKTLIDLKIREQFGVSVVGIIRGEEFIGNPAPDLTFGFEDCLILVGTAKSLSTFKSTYKEQLGRS